MISEGSCDTEDWSNDADNTAILYSNVISLNYYFTVKKNYLVTPNFWTVMYDFCLVKKKK